MILESRENGAISSSADRAGSSPLTSKLQQAWLYSQISKVQRRGVSSTSPVADVATGKRTFRFPLPADSFASSPLASIKTSSVLNASQYEASYVHKSRPGVAGSLDFLRASGGPQLVSYSKKMDKIPPLPYSPTISSSDETCVTATSTSDETCVTATSTSASGSTFTGSNSAESSSSSSASESFSSCVTLGNALQDCAGATNAAEQVDNDEFDGSLDMLGQVEPYLNYLDGILMDEDVEEERLLMEEGGAYLTLTKDLEALIEGEPRAPENIKDDGEESEVPEVYDEAWTEAALGCEEIDTERFIHNYTNRLASHIMDLSLASPSPREFDFRRLKGNEGDSRSDSEELGDLPNHSLDSNQCPAGEISTVSSDAVTDSATAEGVDLLHRCAVALSRGDPNANSLIAELRDYSSAYGTAVQRMAHYYMEAFVARMSGCGPELYVAITRDKPPTAIFLRGIGRLFINSCPYKLVTHFYAMATIADAFAGATRVHVVDYGIAYGAQWAALIQHLSQRSGGPPHLRITGIDFPQPGVGPRAGVEDTGRRLEKFANLWGVPFEYQAVTDKWEAIMPQHLDLRDDEVLAVTCQYRLHHLLDESVMATSPRKLVLSRIRSMNPKVFVITTIEGRHSGPFFLPRFRESIKYFLSMFDAMEVTIPNDDPDRVLFEKQTYGREMLNIIACEGPDRVERPIPYKQWQSLLKRAGFTQMPQNPTIVSKMKGMMGSFHGGYGCAEDAGWFLLGWKNHIGKCMSAWEPTPRSYTT